MTDKTSDKAAPAPKASKAAAATDAPAAPAPKLTRMEQKAADDLAKLRAASVKAEQEANETAARINSNLIKDGNPNRIIGTVREGEPKYFWGNFVPTRALSDEEVEAVRGMKA